MIGIRSSAASENKTGPDWGEGRATAWQVIARTRPYLWPKDSPKLQAFVVIALSALILSRMLNVATPWLFKLGVDELSGTPSAPGWLAIGALGLVAAYGGMRLVGTVMQQLRILIFAPVQERASRRIARDVFAHLHSLSLRFHLQRRTGALSRVIDRGVSSLQSVLSMVFFSIGPLLLEIGMICAVLFVAFDWRFVVIVLVTFSIYVWFTFTVSERRVAHRRAMNDASRDAGQTSLDALLNFETVRYFAATEREEQRYDASLAKLEKTSLIVNRSMVWLNLGQAAIVTIGLVAVMGLAAWEVQRGNLTVGDFVLANAYMLQVIAPLNFLGGVYRQIRQSVVDMDEMFGLLDRQVEIVDAVGAPDLRVSGASVRFDNVHFAYEPERPILRGVSFDVLPGERVAIVGPSGSGKSTIARLLFRFYDPIEGQIQIDGQDLRGVTQDSIQRAIGVVPQDTVLFNDTIGYNIGYGSDDPTPERVVEVADAAQLGGFIASLPEGYDTLVGERGLKLSGGEKQRMGIARTLLKNPPIMIFDEATSALDSETEAGILDALRQAGEGRTVITIAHRLSTIQDADRIIVLEAGQVVEEGSHAALIERQGRYAAMWERQAQER